MKQFKAEMVKFCKDGSDATSGAVRLARAYTGRDLVAICADQPFFSVDDWFIGTTPMNAGIPEAVQQLSVLFPYGDIPATEAVFNKYPNKIAGVILEAARDRDPPLGYLTALRSLCHKHGSLLILDEMITGFRWHIGGAQTYYGVDPDLSAFGKALGNGFAISALAGKREYMRLGGLDHTDRPRVFLLSTTHGAETHALVAAMATTKIYQQEHVVDRLYALGDRLKKGIDQTISRHGLEHYVAVAGKPCCLSYRTLGPDLQPSQAFRTLMLQETIKRGVLMPSLIVSYAHTHGDIDGTVEAIDAALGVYSKALSDGVDRYLIGRPSQIVYRAFNSPEADLTH